MRSWRPMRTGRRARWTTATRHWQILANDQAKKAAEYLPLIVAYRNGAAVRLSDVAEVVDSVQDLRNDGSANGKPAVLLILYRQPNANIIETVDRVKALLPRARAPRFPARSTSRSRWTARRPSAPRCATSNAR